MRVERREIGPCPRCDGTIVERPKSYSCTSWKSSEEPGCGFTDLEAAWAAAPSRPEEAAELVAQGKDVGRRCDAERTVIGPCPTPGCGGEIVERGKSFGCTSWKSRTEPGCGYVIWKRPRGAKRGRHGRGGARPGRRRQDERRAALQRAARRVPDPGLRRADRRELARLRLHLVEEPQGAGLRVRDLEAPGAAARCPARTPIRDARGPASSRRQSTAPSAEPLGPCPTEGCGGQIVERQRSFGCTSWKSKKKPGLRLRDLQARRAASAARSAARRRRTSSRRGLTQPPSEDDAAA